MLTFGPAWNAAMYDNSERFPETPTYARCCWCREFFVEGQQGYVMGHLGPIEAELLVGVGGDGFTLTATHKECLAAQVSGHLVGVCGCQPEFEDRWPSYEASREAWDRLMARGPEPVE